MTTATPTTPDPDALDVPHSRDVEHFTETVAEAIAKSRYTAWNVGANTLTWEEYAADPDHELMVNLYREDGARDAAQVVADLIDSTLIDIIVLPAGLAEGWVVTR